MWDIDFFLNLHPLNVHQLLWLPTLFVHNCFWVLLQLMNIFYLSFTRQKPFEIHICHICAVSYMQSRRAVLYKWETPRLSPCGHSWYLDWIIRYWNNGNNKCFVVNMNYVSTHCPICVITLPDKDKDGEFKWVDKTAITFSNYGPGWPRNTEVLWDCGQIFTGDTSTLSFWSFAASWLAPITERPHECLFPSRKLWRKMGNDQLLQEPGFHLWDDRRPDPASNSSSRLVKLTIWLHFRFKLSY